MGIFRQLKPLAKNIAAKNHLLLVAWNSTCRSIFAVIGLPFLVAGANLQAFTASKAAVSKAGLSERETLMSVGTPSLSTTRSMPTDPS